MASKNGQEESQPAVDYPWRDRSGEVDEEIYVTEEELKKWFNKSTETTEKPCIWQVHNSEVAEVEEPNFFKFYENRAYIVLFFQEGDSTRPQGIRNLHIWVSKYCSRNDYQLAVARVDQLSALLTNPKPTVHREIQLYETDAFHNHEWILEVRLTHKKVLEDSPKRLLQFHIEDLTHRVNKRSSFKDSSKKSSSDDSSQRLRKEWMIERDLLRGNLTTDDVFVLTNLSNFEIFQWNGKKSRMDEQERANKFVIEEQRKFRNESRLRANHILVSEGDGDKNHKMYALFKIAATKRKASVSTEKKAKPESYKYKKFFKLTDDSTGEFMHVAKKDERNMSKSNLPSKHVYLIDTDYQVFLWIGDDWRKEMMEKNIACEQALAGGEEGERLEKEKGKLPPLMLLFEAADRYIVKEYPRNDEEEHMFHLPANKPITLVHEDDQCIALDKALSGH